MSFPQISEILRMWPDAVMPTTPFLDGPCERVRLTLQALRDDSSPVGSADLASLIRYVARREAAQFNCHPRLQVPCVSPWPGKEAWKTHGCFVSDAPQSGFCTIEAQEWLPDWLDQKANWPPFNAVDAEGSPWVAVQSWAHSHRESLARKPRDLFRPDCRDLRRSALF